jgi:flagellar L-ring protein precursor FlgH
MAMFQGGARVLQTDRMAMVTAVVAVVVLTFSGCTMLPDKAPEKKPLKIPASQSEIQTKAQTNPFYTPMPPAEGSLWTEAGHRLFLDKRARRVGDTVTIDIVENASSELEANTETSRDSSIDGSISNALGYVRYLEEKNPRFQIGQSGSLVDQLFKASMENAFKGEAKSDRKGVVTASIGARVIEVLPNGNLVLYGRRETKVNAETQFITVTGLARPEDIDADNRIQSIYIADARIEYFGKGVLADKQKPGIVMRVLDHIWPF